MNTLYAVPNLFVKSALIKDKIIVELIHYALFLIYKGIYEKTKSHANDAFDCYRVTIHILDYYRLHQNHKQSLASNDYIRIKKAVDNGDFGTQHLVFLDPNEFVNVQLILESADYFNGQLTLVFAKEFTDVFDYLKMRKEHHNSEAVRHLELPVLMQLCNGYTKLDLAKVMQLKSTYAVKLYETVEAQYLYKEKKRSISSINLKKLAFRLGMFDMNACISQLYANTPICLSDVEFENQAEWRRMNNNILKPYIERINKICSTKYSFNRVTKEKLNFIYESDVVTAPKSEERKKKLKKSINGFNNFNERNYDYDALTQSI